MVGKVLMSTDNPKIENRTTAAAPTATWAQGNYATIAEQLMAPLGALLVEATGIGPGCRVLDVAAGIGNVAIPAALTGATVVASDLTSELLRCGQKRATEQGVQLEWQHANAEALPFDDDEFDAVLSAIGVMFAPHQQRAADELVRVCRPQGTIGVISWTPGGFMGQLLATVRPYRPTLPPGVPPAALWGLESYIAELLGDTVTDTRMRRAMLEVDRFDDAEAAHQFLKTHFGPVVNAYRTIGDNPRLVRALDIQLCDLAQRHLADGVMGWEYLLVTARKR